MADFADRAQVVTEQHIETALKNRKTLTIPFSGFCLCCGDPVPSSGEGKRRFCDADCRVDWENDCLRKYRETGMRAN